MSAQGEDNVSFTNVGATLGCESQSPLSVEQYGIHHDGSSPRPKFSRGRFLPRPAAVVYRYVIARPTKYDDRNPGKELLVASAKLLEK